MISNFGFPSISDITVIPNSVLNTASSISEAKSYWQSMLSRILSRISGYKLRIEPDHIVNPNAIIALFEVLPNYLDHATLDFGECSFTYEAFVALLNPIGRPRCNLELPSLPRDFYFQITPANLSDVGSLCIHPPTWGGSPEDRDVMVHWLHDIYRQMDRMTINLQSWVSLSGLEELEIYKNKGLMINYRVTPFQYVDEHYTSPGPIKLPKFELLTNERWNKDDCLLWWRDHLKGISGDSLTVGDPSYCACINNPLTITSLFEVLSPRINKIDLSGLIFSTEAWNALVNCLSKHPVTSLKFDPTADQLETFQSNTLHHLEIERNSHSMTSEEEKARLSALLTQHLTKFPNLQSLAIVNWYLSDCHLEFVQNIPVSIENHWIKGEYPNVQLKQTGQEPCDDAALLGNTQFEEQTLSAYWEIIVLDSRSPKMIIGTNNMRRLLIDSPGSIHALFNQLKMRTEFTALAFHRVQFTERAWKVLLENLNPSITSLHFTGCNLSPSMISSLKHHELKELSINSNADLTDKKGFCQAVKEVVHNLVQLSLAGNAITDEDLKEICPKNLSALNLSHNCITFFGNQFLVKSFKYCDIDLLQNPLPLEDQIYRRRELQPLDALLESNEEIFPEYWKRLTQLIDPFTKEEYFRKLLATQFEIVNVPDDGNCLFHACSLGTPFTHQELRKKAVEHMLAKRDLFAPHIEDDKTLDDYATIMLLDKTWGGNVEIAALAQVLECSIAVYSKEHQLEVSGGKMIPNEHYIYHAHEKIDILTSPKTIFLYREKENHYLILNLTKSH